MSQETSWRGILVNASQKYSITLPSSELNTLGSGAAALVEEWVKEHLVDTRLLTGEEFSLWASLNNLRYGGSNRHDLQNDLRSPFSEQALLSASHDLDLETRQLESQSHTIREQIRILKGADVQPQGLHLTKSQSAPALLKRTEAEKQRLLFMNDQLMRELQEKIHTMSGKLEKASKTIPVTVSETIKVDDRILDSVGISPSTNGLKSPDSNLQHQSMLDALQQANILSLKTCLDRHYLEELDSPKTPIANDNIASAIEQAQQDLQLLYIEIEDLAAMLIDHQHGKELRLLEANLTELSAQANCQAMLEVLARLEHLKSTTKQLTDYYHLLLAHRVLHAEFQTLYKQAQARKDLSGFLGGRNLPHDQGEKLGNLLRHLGLNGDSSPETRPTTLHLRETSKSRMDGVQGALTQITNAARSGVRESQEQSQGLLAISDKSLAQAVQQNKTFNHRVASTKLQLETSAKPVDLGI